MPARNVTKIGTSGRNKPIKGFFWIPPVDGSIFKVEVVTSTDTYDVTNFILEGEYTDGITETIGNFSFKIDNSAEQYTDLFSIYDTVKIYMNYGSTANVLKFFGLIERPSYKDHSVVLTGQGGALRVIGKNVTYSATDTARSDVLTAIINKYFSGVITTNNVETDSELISVLYEEKPFWEIVQELCSSGGRDAYIDPNFDFHYFESGSRENSTDAAVHTANLIEIGDFSADLQGVVNRVRVYGSSIGEVIIMATANDTDSQNNLNGDIRELLIKDSSITTVQQAQDRADFELAINKDPPTVGEVTSLLLPTLSPGERVRVSDPLNGLSPSYYTIQKYTHKFSNSEPPKTILTIQKERASIPTILKKRIKFESDIPDTNNPNEMDYSIFYDFSENTGEHSNTQIDTVLRILKATGSPASWTTDVTPTQTNVTSIEPRLSGSNLSGTKVFISLNGGGSYVEARYNETSFSKGNVGTIPDGNQIKARINLGSETTEINSFGILYKKE